MQVYADEGKVRQGCATGVDDDIFSKDAQGAGYHTVHVTMATRSVINAQSKQRRALSTDFEDSK